MTTASTPPTSAAATIALMPSAAAGRFFHTPCRRHEATHQRPVAGAKPLINKAAATHRHEATQDSLIMDIAERCYGLYHLCLLTLLLMTTKATTNIYPARSSSGKPNRLQSNSHEPDNQDDGYGCYRSCCHAVK